MTLHKQYNISDMTRTIRDIDCRRHPYRKVLVNVQQELCQGDKKMTLVAIKQALHRGNVEVELIFWKHVKAAEEENERRLNQIEVLKRQSTNETASAVS